MAARSGGGRHVCPQLVHDLHKLSMQLRGPL
eukprot:CAMPEP_0182905294 /NCGR_PEP_ID=MMETSP0034_2-20130328/32834_1 /TAXON_ID=156128 /ORGANISM="Nephroselmis pyriformis, Strain CCMP717" /LENGTH=30 /DNA_ID= /DNA_START= /DNA_END= /DNA_ORIENTATION=